ncbi:MAG: PAS domain S-box protein, partial [Nitrospinae bacterium]|nr:PAS domain S-box protein [Nitrospinota bacterium]
MVNRNFNTRRTGYTFILIFALMSVGIIFTGYIYYRNYEQKYRFNVESQLSSIADLKMSELALWRRERLGDGSLLFKNKTFSALVRRFMENPEDADAKRRLDDWMGKYTTAYQYARVVLFDAQAGIRLSAPEKANTDDLEIERNVAAILREGQVAFQDFHRETTDGLIHLAVVVPIFDEADESQTLGVLAIDIDPAAYLYPFISRWPTPSKTGETLLIRRDGDDVLYLNELKFNKDAALNLRIPLTKTDVPSVKAALGQKGVVEGLDYRGKPVIAAVGAVPDSPWYLVARIDTEEVYGPLIERMWLMVTVVGLLLAGSGMGMGLIWRQRSARFYKERYQVAEALRESEERYRSLFENNHAVMLVINPDDGNIVEANPAAVAYYGWSREELKLKKISDINTLTPDQIHAEMELAHAEKRSHFFFKHLRADGAPRDVEVYSGPVNVKGRALLYSIVFDITERRQAEKSLQRAYALLNDTQRLAKIGGWEFDVEKQSMFWTDEVYRIHDLDPGEITPDSTEHIARSLECYRPEDRPVILAAFQRCAQEGEPYDLELAFTTTKGRKLWIRTTANPLFDSGKVVRVVGDIMDITERKLAEEELQRFFDLVPDMVCIAS